MDYGEQYRVLLAGADVSLDLCYPAHIDLRIVRSFFLLSKEIGESFELKQDYFFLYFWGELDQEEKNKTEIHCHKMIQYAFRSVLGYIKKYIYFLNYNYIKM